MLAACLFVIMRNETLSWESVNLIASITMLGEVVEEIKHDLLPRLTCSMSWPCGYLEKHFSYYISKGD